jgi:hypothetical protein
MKEVQYTEADSLTVTNTCSECIAQEQLCTECVDTADARLTDKAFGLVDEGNLQYKYQWLLVTEPSGHDWTDRDGEFKEPIVFLQDGGVYEELWELDDMRQRAREVECHWCHLLTPKQFNDCQSCDKPLEHNVVSDSLMKVIVDMVLEGEGNLS